MKNTRLGCNNPKVGQEELGMETHDRNEDRTNLEPTPWNSKPLLSNPRPGIRNQGEFENLQSEARNKMVWLLDPEAGIHQSSWFAD